MLPLEGSRDSELRGGERRELGKQTGMRIETEVGSKVSFP
jgi:hypothetical protein